jgi:hypothetical protein
MTVREKNEDVEYQRRFDARKAFGQFSSLKTQKVTVLKPVEIILDSQDVAGGVRTIDFDKGDIMIKQSGMYLIIAGLQVGKTRGTKNRWIDFWFRINDKNLPNSNVRKVLTHICESDVVPLNAVLDLNKGDLIKVIMAAETDDEGIGIEAIEPDGEPLIPSMILTVIQLD